MPCHATTVAIRGYIGGGLGRQAGGRFDCGRDAVMVQMATCHDKPAAALSGKRFCFRLEVKISRYISLQQMVGLSGPALEEVPKLYR